MMDKEKIRKLLIKHLPKPYFDANVRGIISASDELSEEFEKQLEELKAGEFEPRKHEGEMDDKRLLDFLEENHFEVIYELESFAVRDPRDGLSFSEGECIRSAIKYAIEEREDERNEQRFGRDD